METAPKPKRLNKNKQLLQSELPSSVSILGRELKVTVTNLKGLHGDFSLDKSLIRIHQSVPVESAKDTLFHEMIHAALAISGHNEMLTEGQEEAIVRMMEHAFSGYFDIKKSTIDKSV